jgi:uncharacterized protein YbjT (DUF2867 family)
VARHLLRQGWHVRAMTRHPGGAPARLLQAAGAELVQADFLDRPSLTRALTGAYGAFSVQNMLPLGTVVETIQGYAFADAALAAGVRHFVYSSVGGADRATGIGHFESKWAVEEHIRRIGVPATILRPVFFIDNLTTPGPWGRVAWGAVAWALRGGKKLQVLAVDDIGAFVALVLADPQRFVGQAIELAGDEVTLAQMRAAQVHATGKRRLAIPLPPAVLSLLDRDLSQMFRWLRTSGYAADLVALRQLLPSLKRLEDGLRSDENGPPPPAGPR